MSYEIVTDSTCNLTEEYIEQAGLPIIPFPFMVGDEIHYSYLKGETVDVQQFFTSMREGKVFTTSLPNLIESERLFRSLLDAGRDVLYLGFSSGLSSAYEAMDLLLRGLSEEYPERKLFFLDTLCVCGGQGLIVHEALERRAQGMPIEEVARWADENKLNIAHWFTVDDLMFLFRGGRVSKTSAWAGTMLNIKPVLHVDDEGKLIAMEKVRGRKKALNGLVEHMKASAIAPAADQTVLINHGDCIEDALYVKDRIKEELGVTKFMVNYIDPVIGAHSGPGTVALFFIADKR